MDEPKSRELVEWAATKLRTKPMTKDECEQLTALVASFQLFALTEFAAALDRAESGGGRLLLSVSPTQGGESRLVFDFDTQDARSENAIAFRFFCDALELAVAKLIADVETRASAIPGKTS